MVGGRRILKHGICTIEIETIPILNGGVIGEDTPLRPVRDTPITLGV